MTIYPYAGTNQAPVPTTWQAAADFLDLPASGTTLSATATDPELDTIRYAWSIVSQPNGANAQLATPNAASCAVTGMSAAGMYIFRVSISDAGHTVTRDVRVPVYATNQPPIIVEVHNRIPVTITLPLDTTIIRGYAWDPEGDPISLKWRVISQPVGATAIIAKDDTASTTLSNLTVAGNYLLEITFSDPTHAVSDTLEIPVYPVNANAPTITSATASAASIRLPVDSLALSAVTSDANGDMITHWWSVKSKPGGARPLFDKQGSSNTKVRDLDSVGTYVFTLTVVDRTRYVTRDVTVNVLANTTGLADKLPPAFLITTNAVGILYDCMGRTVENRTALKAGIYFMRQDDRRMMKRLVLDKK
jgi:hypothetical protein